MVADIIEFLIRWMHALFGIAWIGLLYYFNFVQGEYLKQAAPEAATDVKAKLVPRALGWFRWAAMFTFISGLLLFGAIGHKHLTNNYIVVGALLGTLMFLNVWLIIWPKQKIVLGLAEGDAASAGPKAALASRTNTLFSGPLVLFMLASPHLGYVQDHLLGNGGGGASSGLWLSIALVLVLEANVLFGKMGPMASIRGVIHMSLALAAALFCLLALL